MDIEYVPLAPVIVDNVEFPDSCIVAPGRGAADGPVTVPEMVIVPVAACDDVPSDSCGEKQPVAETSAQAEQTTAELLRNCALSSMLFMPFPLLSCQGVPLVSP